MKTIALTDHPTLKQAKFGRRRPVAAGPQFRLSNYLRASLPPAPATADYGAAARPVLDDVMGNQALGDCVIAGGYHVVGVETGNAGNLFHATLPQIEKDYSAIGGYVPGDESTDQGCDEPTALNYWTQHGFANGTKLLGWLAVDPNNRQELMAACYLFENLFFGIELPDAWVNPFPAGNGFVWDVAGDPVPENGHAVIGYGYGDRGVKIDSWALDGVLTWAAIAKYCARIANGAVYVLLTPDQLAKGAAKAPNGVAWHDLIVDFDAMGGHVPVPPAPTPPPPPTGPISLAQVETLVTTAINHSPSIMTRAMAIKAVNATLAANWPKS
jgi:hypothetical protein